MDIFQIKNVVQLEKMRLAGQAQLRRISQEQPTQAAEIQDLVAAVELRLEQLRGDK